MLVLTAVGSILVFGAEPPPASAPEKSKPAKSRSHIVVQDEMKVQGDTKRAVQIVIPRDQSVAKEIDAATDHLLDASHRR